MACSGYDAGLLGSQAKHAKKDAAVGASATVAVDGAISSVDGGDASQLGMPASGTGGRGAGGGGAGSGEGGGAGTGACVVNPDPARSDCPMICPEQCNGADDDCDGTIDEDVDNACSLDHAVAGCVRGRCAIVQCSAGYRDCDHSADNGCEIAPGDVNNCGGCGMTCVFPNAIAACVGDHCVPAGCNALYADCDQNPNDCETMANTLQNCGGCGSRCADGDVPNATASCQSGACGVGQCLGAYGDCDGLASDGCEQSLSTNAHCSACNAPCDFVGSVDDCSSGSCLAQSCEPGYDDCDGDPGNGCEALDQPAHCGACNKTCDLSLSNVAGASCDAGACVLACANGFDDCDGDVSTGCETALSSLQRCGACNGTCAIANADSSCDSGSCMLVRCKPGWGDCNGSPSDGCETPLDQNDHCGTCTTSCVGTASPACSGGACSTLSCAAGTADCDRDGTTCETDLKTDASNCGACGNVCSFSGGSTHASGLSCVAGQCVPACNASFGNCNGDYTDGCETSLDTLTSCGGCGVGCSIANATATCGSGSCRVSQCAADYADCDGDGKSCEVKLGTTTNCTGCGLVCAPPNAVPSCTGSPGSHACAVSSCAQTYFADCDGMPADGCEIDTRSDRANCGACSNDCGALPHVTGASCAASACSFGCVSGYSNCNAMPGCETALNTNTDCVGCGVSCSRANGSASCSSGSCALTACNTGYKDCDSNPANGCEPLTTLSNCGDCGVACTIVNGVGSCTTGSCALSSCNSGWADCDGSAGNGCERNVNPPAMGGQGPCLPDTMGCTHQVYAGEDYYFCTTARTWSDARTHCQQQLLGDLVHINDMAEDTFVHSNMGGDSWIGSTDSATEGTWLWVDDNTQFWVGTSSGTGTGYTNWKSGEPNNNNNEDCGEYYVAGQWNDKSCSSTLAFVCEVQLDQCPSDPNKIKPGQCGCGVADTDTDSDGTADCHDGCPNDKNKTAAGACGCGVADTDTDGDGTADCHDGCPNDKNKTAAGTCGCGVPDVDTDGDSMLDCVDPCPTNPSNPPGCFPYIPSNVDVTMQSFSSSPSWSCTNNATTTIDSSAGTLSGDNCGGTATLDATNDVAQLDPTAPTVMIVRLGGLSVSGNHVIKLVGNKPIVFLVNGNVSITGTGVVDGSANGTTASGPGGDLACGASQGGNNTATGSCGGLDGYGGAGGGGFGTSGGQGGTGNTDNIGNAPHNIAGSTAGAARGESTLAPLLGGCRGGNGDSGSGVPGGRGGGAVQISASGTLTVTGTVRANGGNGSNGCGSEGSGAGGGSGGGILLEGATVSSTGTLQANGGRGGDSAWSGSGGAGSSSSGSNGSAGQSSAGGGNGGGGGYGRTLAHVGQ